jgi:hypothetical protein
MEREEEEELVGREESIRVGVE